MTQTLKNKILEKVLQMCPARIDIYAGSNIEFLCSLIAESLAPISRALNELPEGETKSDALRAFDDLVRVPAKVLHRLTGE